jgi:hypothetical protein
MQQRPFYDREPTTITSSKSKLGASSSSRRLPLQSKNPNSMGGNGTFNNSSTEEYNLKDMAVLNLNPLSTLESSNNDNNKGINSTANSHGSARHIRRGSASSEPREHQEQPARSSSVPRAALSQPSSLPTTTMDEDSIVIEEKRRRTNGEGFTLHRYLRGRLLGKGGFAKVYLCTALDTNKAYAVKVVPKANLVKSRARQKVRFSGLSSDYWRGYLLLSILTTLLMIFCFFFSCKRRLRFTAPSSTGISVSTSTSLRIARTVISYWSYVTIKV